MTLSARGLSLTLRALMFVLGTAFILDVPADFFNLALWQEQTGLVILGLVCADIFITCTFKGTNRAETGSFPGKVDLLLAVVSLLLFFYATARFEQLVGNGYLGNTEGLVVSIGAILLAAETARRTCGGWLVVILIAFMLYALVADQFGGLLQGRAVGPEELFNYSVLDPSGLLGSSLSVVTTTVLAFIIFGATLFGLGGGRLFLDSALTTMRGIRGGAGKGAIVASTLFGTISGSAVSNVVTVGIVTIPMMTRSGFSKKDAAAIEAVASTGGQIMPPIMGSAAFIMADTLSIPYREVAIAALLPALLYYLTLFLQVHFRAARQNIKPLETSDIAPLGETLRGYWPFLIPVLLLVWMLFSTAIAPHKIAMWATAACIIASLLTPEKPTRKRITDIIDAIGSGMASIIPAVAVSGVIIAVLSVTGLGFTFGLSVVDEAGGSLPLLLILSAIASLVLGLGLPTTAVYIVMAGLVAPALTAAGVPDLAAHLFVFYFGVLSMITPPVCLAAMAAASIAGSDFMQTGNESMKLAFTGFIVPFLFTLMPLLLSFDLLNPVYWLQTGCVVAGLVLLAGSFEGYLHKNLTGLQRWALAGLSIILFALPLF